MLNVLIITTIGTLIIFALAQPYKKQKYDDTVKPVKKISIIYSSLINIVYWGVFCGLVYMVNDIVHEYHKFGHILMNNNNLNKAASDIVIPNSTFDKLMSPIAIGFVIGILLTGIVIYVGLLTISKLVIQLVAYKRYKEDPYLSRLIVNLKEAKMTYYSSAYFNAVANAYFKMKESHSKGKLYIDQWKDIIQILLLVGENKEAEKLNAYIFERTKCSMRLEVTFSKYLAKDSVYKVGLYDYKQLDKDKAQVKKRENKRYRNKKQINN